MLAIDKTPHMIDFKIPYVNIQAVKNNSKQLENIKGPIVIDNTHDPYSMIEVEQICKQAGIQEAIYITSNYEDLHYKNTIFFPYFFYRSSLLYNQLRPPIDKRSNLISCLNRRPTAHRFYTVYKILTSNIKDQFMFSCHGLICPYSRTILDFEKDFSSLPQNIIDWLKQQDLQVRAYTGDDGNDFSIGGNPGDHTWNHPAFSDTYLNIVTESAVNCSFLSEKSFKPLAAGQLFLQVGGQQNVAAIKSLGFETYDQAFDQHNYLGLESYIDRIDKMFLTIEQIESIEELYFRNLQQLKFNQEFALSDSFLKKCLLPFKSYNIV